MYVDKYGSSTEPNENERQRFEIAAVPATREKRPLASKSLVKRCVLAGTSDVARNLLERVQFVASNQVIPADERTKPPPRAQILNLSRRDVEFLGGDCHAHDLMAGQQ